MSEPLEQALQRPWIWRGRGRTSRQGLATGRPELDQVLPEGWSLGAITEILVAAPGCGEISLLLPALSALAREGGRIAWVTPPWIPYPPALSRHDLEPVVVVRTRQSMDELWAAEQLLRSGACAAVLCWPERLDDRRFRRLQLAAEAGRCWGVVFRDGQSERSPAALRLRVEARGSRQRLTVLKRRGLPPPAPLEWSRPAGLQP